MTLPLSFQLFPSLGHSYILMRGQIAVLLIVFGFHELYDLQRLVVTNNILMFHLLLSG